MEQANGSRADNATLGVALIVGSVFLLSLGDALVKLASADLSLWQLYVARGLITVPALVALLLLGGRPAAFRPRSPGWVLLRSMLLVAMWIAYYAALPVMSLSAAAVALYTTPLFIALFSALLIGEPVGAKRWAGIVVGFAGVLAILRPGTDAFSKVTLLPVAAAVLYALAAVVTRAKCIGERPLVLSFVLNLCLLGVGLAATGVLALLHPGSPGAPAHPFLLCHWAPMGTREWGLVALLAVLIVVVSTGVAKAYQAGPAAVIGTFDYAYLAFAALWGFVLFSEVPDGATAAGMALIAAAGGLVVGRSMDEPMARSGGSARRRG